MRALTFWYCDACLVGEYGTHDALMAADGRYAALFRTQAERFQDGLAAGEAR